MISNATTAPHQEVGAVATSVVNGRRQSLSVTVQLIVRFGRPPVVN
jgi:hypothetical protein